MPVQSQEIPVLFQYIQAVSQNIILLLAFTFSYSLIRPAIRAFGLSVHAVARGVLFGGFAVLLPPVALAPGIFLDGRTIPFMIAGAFGGWRSALTALVIFLPYRLLVGGLGAPPSVVTSIMSAVLGALIYRWHGRETVAYRAPHLLLMGLAAAVIRFVGTLALPQDIAAPIFSLIFVPVLVTYPLGTYLAGMLLMREKRRILLEDATMISDLAFRATLDALLVTDVRGRIVTANPAAARLFFAQDTLPEPIGHAISEFLTPESWDSLQAEMARMAAQSPSARGGCVMEAVALAAGGSAVPVKLSVASSANRRGSVTGFVLVMHDLTDQKQAEAIIEQDRALLRTLIDSLPDLIFVKDSNGRFLMVNAAHARFLGADSPDDVTGKTDFDFYPREIAERFHADEREIFQTRMPLINQEEPKTPEQGGGWVLMTKLPMFDSSGNILGLIGTARDITDRKQAESLILEAKVEREKVELISRFLSDVSHDIRTPLSVMSTSLYLLRRNSTPAQQAQLDTLEVQTAHIHRLIEDMFTLSRLDLAKTEFTFACHDMNVIAREVAFAQQAAVNRKHQVLHLDLWDSPVEAQVDHVEMLRALQHLVANAISYTPDGDTIRLKTFARDHQAIVEVHDNGIGISADDLPRIFDRFFRADKARSTETGGTGLGLSITRKIIEAHGGSIEVESEPGQGSVFRVILPAGVPQSV